MKTLYSARFALGLFALIAACGQPSGLAPRRRSPPDLPRSSSLAALKLEGSRSWSRAATSRFAPTAADDTWKPLAQGKALAGVRDVKVVRQGAVLAIGHGDAAGRVWLRAGTELSFGQDDHGVHLDVRGGRARVRREASQLPLFANGRAITGDVVVEGDDIVETGARPEARRLVARARAARRRTRRGSHGRARRRDEAGQDEPLALRSLSVEVHTSGDLRRDRSRSCVLQRGRPAPRGHVSLFPCPTARSSSAWRWRSTASSSKASIVEREKAREIYDQTVDKMLDPALLEWEEGNLVQVARVPDRAEGGEARDRQSAYASPLAHTPKGWEYQLRALAKPDPRLRSTRSASRSTVGSIAHERAAHGGRRSDHRDRRRQGCPL